MAYTRTIPQAYYDENQTEWDEIGISKSQKRMLIATWTSVAWAELCAAELADSLIRTAFVDTGFLLAKDGSENGLVKLQGWTGDEAYDF
jgi:hypothetical protein